jgi:tetratricopeptide (TPR) repeat protein
VKRALSLAFGVYMNKMNVSEGQATTLVEPENTSQFQDRQASLFRDGMEAQKNGDFLLAITKYKAALQAGQESFDLLFNLGICLDKENHIDSAIKAFKSAAELYPQHKPTLLHLTSLFIEKGEKEESLKYWAKYLQLAR